MELKDKTPKNMKNSIHEKAIRLVEGGIVDVDGHAVKLVNRTYIVDPCFLCEMDSLCHKGNEMCSVCEECDRITKNNCFLILLANYKR